ncbi:MAG: hypothetical protein ACE37H_06510 [Phycisphaeraceae bacterium]
MRSIFCVALLTGLSLFAAAPLAADAGEIEKRPGYQMPLEKVHPGWTLEQARPEGFEPQCGAIAFSPDGKYFALLTFNPKRTGAGLDRNGTLWISENITDKDPSQIKFTKVSEDFSLPLGANWLDDGLFVLDRFELSKWTDSDGDGIPDKKKTFASGWTSDNFHHFSFGLPYHDGYFYGTLSTSLHLSQEERDTIKPNPDDPIAGRVSDSKGKTLGGNAPNPPHRGNVMKIDAKTGDIAWIAGGLRTPNGPGIGPEGIVLAPDNQGDWKPANMIYVVKGGEFLGKYNSTASHINLPDGGVPSLYHEKEPTPPAVWLPQNEIGNSPSATLLIPEGKPFAGQVLSADITQGAIHRIFMEEVDGTWQGAAFRHTMGFEAGPNDIKWGPDGCLYVAHMGAGGNTWGWGTTLFGLQRLRPTGKTAFEFEKIEATRDGFRVSFTKPVKAGMLEQIDNWVIDAYTYVATPFYGGPKREQHDVVPTKVTVAEDRKSAELVIEDRKPNFVYHICIDAVSAEGEAMWSPESWVTFHKAPKD